MDSCDRNLVHRAQIGERAAFNSLVSKYRHRIMQLSMRYTRNRADAEDAVQNTFMKAYRGLGQFRGDSAFYSWLHCIAVNSAKTLVAQRAREMQIFSPECQSVEAVNARSRTTPELDSPERIALTVEICSVVNSAIQKLSDEQRTAIELRELDGLSYAEMAQKMACPIGTVRSRVFRARETIDGQLRRVLDDGLSRRRRNQDFLAQI